MNLDTPGRKAAAIAFSIVAIAGSAFWIWNQSREPAPELKHAQFVAMGRVLADETASAIAHRPKKRVLIISADTDDPALKVQLDSLRATLKKHPEIDVKDTEFIESDNKKSVRPGQGLSARKFARLIEKNVKADAIVSLVGMPKADDKDLADLKAKVPRVIAFVGDRDRVPELIARKMLRIAVVPRYQFPAPVQEPKTPQEAFDKYFQIIRAPKSTNEPAETATAPDAAKK